MQTYVVQINRQTAQGGGQTKLRLNPANFASVKHFMEEIEKNENIVLNEGEYLERIEIYDKNLGKFQVLSDTESTFDHNSALFKGPTQLVIHIANKDLSNATCSNFLMLKGRMLNIVEDGLPVVNSLLRISSPGAAELGTGLTIWDGSIVLAKYLENFPEMVKNKNILEVGSGTGIVGIVAGLLGAKLSVLTDLPYTLPNLQSNINQNRPPSDYNVIAQELDWFDSSTYPTDAWDIIVGADVVWVEDLILPLVRTLSSIARPGTDVLIAHQTRSKFSDEIFFSNMAKYFTKETIVFEIPEGYTSGAEINIFRFRRV